MLGIKSDDKCLLTALKVLPHDKKRKDELSQLKDGPKRRDILRMSVSCEEAPLILGSAPLGNHDALLEAKFGQNGKDALLKYGTVHERDSLKAYRDEMKKKRITRVNMYAPGLFACEDAPFLLCAPQYIQTSPSPALIFMFNVHEIPESLPDHIYDQVLCSLAITAGQCLPECDATAIIFFCPPQGPGKIEEIKFGKEEKDQWFKHRLRLVAFFTARMLPLLTTTIDIAEIPSARAVTTSPQSPGMRVAEPQMDQTPSLKVGKVVYDPKDRHRVGTITRLFEDGKATVDWKNEQKIRDKKYNGNKLRVATVVKDDYERPNKQGQAVQIVASTMHPHLVGKMGIVQRYSTDSSSVQTEDGVTVKIKTANLKLVGTATGRKVTVPASEFATEFPFSDGFEELMTAHMREQNVRLASRISIARFVQEGTAAIENFKRAAEEAEGNLTRARRRKNVD